MKISKEVKVDSKSKDLVNKCHDTIIKGDNTFEKIYLVNFNEYVEEKYLELSINLLDYDASDKYAIGTVTNYEARIN